MPMGVRRRGGEAYQSRVAGDILRVGVGMRNGLIGPCWFKKMIDLLVRKRASGSFRRAPSLRSTGAGWCNTVRSRSDETAIHDAAVPATHGEREQLTEESGDRLDRRIDDHTDAMHDVRKGRSQWQAPRQMMRDAAAVLRRARVRSERKHPSPPSVAGRTMLAFSRRSGPSRQMLTRLFIVIRRTRPPALNSRGSFNILIFLGKRKTEWVQDVHDQPAPA